MFFRRYGYNFLLVIFIIIYFYLIPCVIKSIVFKEPNSKTQLFIEARGNLPVLKKISASQLNSRQSFLLKLQATSLKLSEIFWLKLLLIIYLTLLRKEECVTGTLHGAFHTKISEVYQIHLEWIDYFIPLFLQWF